MLAKLKLFVAATMATGALATGIGVSGASAQGPVITGGLVNVTVTNLLNNNDVDVTVPVQAGVHLGANVCGVNAAVLAAEFLQNGTASCTNNQDTRQVQITPVL
jgi:hypothetical protein